MNINKVAVIGAGVMGANIAAHIANAGIPVRLLDIVPEDATNRNIIAERAIRKLQKTDPPALMRKKNARLITPGNIEDDLEQLRDVDWVIEAIVENLDIKKALYKKLHPLCPDNTLISSNTSTLPLHLLVADLPDEFQLRFMITHFFNPPRYMRLLEWVKSPVTRPELIDGLTRFADLSLGKGCVQCKDTPGFIANRIGVYWLQFGVLEAFKRGLSVEEADAVMGVPLGIPKTGVFGLLDLIGLDLMPLILGSMQQNLVAGDALQKISAIPGFVKTMIESGYIGRKGKGGFYRLNKRDGKRIKESRSLLTGIYRPSEKPDLPNLQLAAKSLPEFFEYDDKTSRYAWQVMSHTLVYAAGLIPEIADDLTAIDQAMRLGFNWKHGPFELYDRIGPRWFNDKLSEEGRDIPELLQNALPCYKNEGGTFFYIDRSGLYQKFPKKSGLLHLSHIKKQRPPVLSNASASLWDIGDAVCCLEFHSKMNTLDMATMELLQQSIDRVQNEFAALVIYNEGEHFSAGANLKLLLDAINKQNWNTIETLLTTGQQTYQAIKYASFPVVGAPSGLALGGGCEILLHCDAVQAHAELYMGLVEVGVGLIPAWGGCKEFLHRCLQQKKRPGGPIPPLVKAFETIGMAKVSKSAFEAQDTLFLSPSDAITMNRDRLLADAKQKALALQVNYSPPGQSDFPLPGKTAYIMMKMAGKALRLTGKISDYDLEIAQQLAHVLSGGSCVSHKPLAEADVLALEREAFGHLVKQKQTVQRLQYMLKTGKPLRN